MGEFFAHRLSPVKVSRSLATAPRSPACSSGNGLDGFTHQHPNMRQPLIRSGAEF